jgi:hypothetical protein
MRRHPFRRVLAAALLGMALTVPAQEAVRPEIGKPLQAAQELIRAHRYREALSKVHEAEAAGVRNANETFLIERMRIAAASGAGDAQTMARSFEIVGPRVPAAERLRMIESLANGYYRGKDYTRAMQWAQRYFKEGGQSAAMRSLLIQSQYLAGDYAGAARELTAQVTQAEKAGQMPGEDQLKLLASAALKRNDTAGYAWALERLVVYYPRQEYWGEILARLQRKPGFSDRLALDTYRLALATGTLAKPADFLEMTQLALQAGLPAEAQQVVERGFAAGVLGKGPEAERHRRLKALTTKRLQEAKAVQAQTLDEARAAKDGNALLHAGMHLIFLGDQAQGLQLMAQGLAQGNLKRPEDAKLHYAIAQILTGDPVRAQATLRAVGGNDGTADLARLWGLYLRKKG